MSLQCTDKLICKILRSLSGVEVIWHDTPSRLLNSYRRLEGGILIDPEEEGTTILRHADTYLPIDTA
jgi:hypothetical protein